MPQQVMVQVRFQEKTEVGEYHDALYFTQAEFALLIQTQIDILKTQRATKWADSVKNAPPALPATKAELQVAIASLEAQKKSYQDEIDKIEGK